MFDLRYSAPTTLGGATCCMVLSIFYFIFKGKKRLPFPPGPEPLPIVGNMYDMPVQQHGARYMEMGKRYKSNILHFYVLGAHYIVLNTLEDAEELLERRASNYSGRTYMPTIKMIGWYINMSWLPLGSTWRKHRRAFQQYFRQNAVGDYHDIQLTKVHKMLGGLLVSPERFEEHNKLLSVSIPMSMMFGHDLESLNDPFIEAADENARMAFHLVQPESTLINIVHWLQYIPTWVPGTFSQRMAKETKKLTEFLRNTPMDALKAQLNEGTAVSSSIVARYLDGGGNSDALEEKEKIIGDVAFTAYVAASDTTISATATFVHALATHPDILKKAQQEIDAVVGTARLPTFDDRQSMPYIEAIYREVLRWKPPLPLSMIHQAAEDDVYRGYFIPKGTNVIPNVWGMARDASKYTDPDEFNPDRFLTADGRLNNDNRVLAYGFGRRICVGKHVASGTLWLTFASLIAVFNMGKATDKDGNEIEIKGDYDETGLIMRVKPFQCSITPRSEAARQLILEANKKV